MHSPSLTAHAVALQRAAATIVREHGTWQRLVAAPQQRRERVVVSGARPKEKLFGRHADGRYAVAATLARHPGWVPVQRDVAAGIAAKTYELRSLRDILRSKGAVERPAHDLHLYWDHEDGMQVKFMADLDGGHLRGDWGTFRARARSILRKIRAAFASVGLAPVLAVHFSSGAKPSAHVLALKGAWGDDATSLRKTFVEPVLLPLLDADECSAASPVFDKAFPKTGAFRVNGCCKWGRGEARYLSQEPDAAFSDAEAVRLFREDRLQFELLSCPTYIAPDDVASRIPTAAAAAAAPPKLAGRKRKRPAAAAAHDTLAPATASAMASAVPLPPHIRGAVVALCGDVTWRRGRRGDDGAVFHAFTLPPTAPCHFARQPHDTLSPREAVEYAKKLLDGLKPRRAVEYDAWFRVGAALHAVDAAALLDAWDAWSRRHGGAKYEAGACARKWRSMAARARDSGMAALCAMFNRDTGHNLRIPANEGYVLEKASIVPGSRDYTLRCRRCPGQSLLLGDERRAFRGRRCGHQPRLPPHIVAAIEKTLGRVTWLHSARGGRGRSFVHFSHGVGGGDPASHRAFVTARSERVGGTTYLLTCRQCPGLAAALVGDDTAAVLHRAVLRTP